MHLQHSASRLTSKSEDRATSHAGRPEVGATLQSQSPLQRGQAMMRSIVLVAALALAGCSSSTMPVSEAKPAAKIFDMRYTVEDKSKGSIIVKRDRGGVLGMRNCSHRITFDGKPVADLDYGEAVPIFATPGEHLVGLGYNTFLCNTGDSQLAVAFEAGKTKFVRIVIDPNGRATLQQSVD